MAPYRSVLARIRPNHPLHAYGTRPTRGRLYRGCDLPLSLRLYPSRGGASGTIAVLFVSVVLSAAVLTPCPTEIRVKLGTYEGVCCGRTHSTGLPRETDHPVSDGCQKRGALLFGGVFLKPSLQEPTE